MIRIMYEKSVVGCCCRHLKLNSGFRLLIGCKGQRQFSCNAVFQLLLRWLFKRRLWRSCLVVRYTSMAYRHGCTIPHTSEPLLNFREPLHRLNSHQPHLVASSHKTGSSENKHKLNDMQVHGSPSRPAFDLDGQRVGLLQSSGVGYYSTAVSHRWMGCVGREMGGLLR